MTSSTSPATDKTAELSTLKSDLEQLIELSKETLLDLKKKKLLEELDLLTGTESETNHTNVNNKEDANDIVGINFQIKKTLIKQLLKIDFFIY